MRHNRIKTFLFLFSVMLCIVSGSYAQQQKVQAKRGEGVTLLLQRYNLSPKLYEAEFRKLNKGTFTADGGLKMGVTYLLPKTILLKGRHRLKKRKFRRKNQTNAL